MSLCRHISIPSTLDPKLLLWDNPEWSVSSENPHFWPIWPTFGDLDLLKGQIFFENFINLYGAYIDPKNRKNSCHISWDIRNWLKNSNSFYFMWPWPLTLTLTKTLPIFFFTPAISIISKTRAFQWYRVFPSIFWWWVFTHCGQLCCSTI